MIPCCFHPTRVVIVESQLQLTNFVEGDLAKSPMTFDAFSCVDKAIHYMNEIYHPEPFYDRYIPKSGGDTKQIRAKADTHQEIYRPQRFEEISTVVMDFSSFVHNSDVEMTGLEFFGKIKDPNIQRILIIDGEDPYDFCDALNSDVIHYCINKQDSDWKEKLLQALKDAQWQYFNKMSEVFMKNLHPSDGSEFAFADPNFEAFFKSILSNYGFTEAYLCESTGSYLFLDEQAQDHGLVVNIPEQLDCWVRSGQAKGINIPLLKELKNRKKMMCYSNSNNGLEPDKSHWEIYAHPAKTLKGRDKTFYYAFEPNIYDIDLERILPFEAYRENQQRKVGRLH